MLLIPCKQVIHKIKMAMKGNVSYTFAPSLSDVYRGRGKKENQGRCGSSLNGGKRIDVGSLWSTFLKGGGGDKQNLQSRLPLPHPKMKCF